MAGTYALDGKSRALPVGWLAPTFGRHSKQLAGRPTKSDRPAIRGLRAKPSAPRTPRPSLSFESLLEEVGLQGHDPLVQRLEPAPSSHRRPDSRRGALGLLGIDEHCVARRLGEQLR